MTLIGLVKSHFELIGRIEYVLQGALDCRCFVGNTGKDHEVFQQNISVDGVAR